MHRIPLNSTNLLLLVEITIPPLSSPSMIGIWQIIVIQQSDESILGSSNFLLLASNENYWLNVQYLTILKNFWSISDICSTQTNENNCNLPLNRTNCVEQRWSSFFSDI